MSSDPTYVIWSIEHDAWWRPHRIGYTQDLGEAGVYSERASVEILNRANIVKVNECRIPLVAVGHADWQTGKNHGHPSGRSTEVE